MPFADSSFDYVVCAAAFKNFNEPAAALAEMHRVLVLSGQGYRNSRGWSILRLFRMR